MHNYIRSERKNRETGTIVLVADTDHPDTEFVNDGDRWLTICVDHSMLCSHPTLSLAMAHAAVPSGWCEFCRSIATGEPLPTEPEYDEDGNVVEVVRWTWLLRGAR